jgi:hypothetical protein
VTATYWLVALRYAHFILAVICACCMVVRVMWVASFEWAGLSVTLRRPQWVKSGIALTDKGVYVEGRAV